MAVGSVIASPLSIVPIIALLRGYTTKIVSPADRLQEYHNIIPVLLGFLLFISFGILAVYRPKNYVKCEEPEKETQLIYFKEVYEFTIRRNNAIGDYKTPYLINILCFGSVLLLIPLMYWLYNQKDTY